jgi:hyperosmotically inducible protein
MRDLQFLAVVTCASVVLAWACGRTDAPSNAGGDQQNLSDVTAMDQSQSSADLKITADIRRAIMDDETMSVRAQNCTIVTDKTGKVTLRGIVGSQAEKDSIDAKARAIAGPTRVDNRLEIEPA